MDGLDESADPPYLVPTHLGEGQSIGPIPVRTFYVVLASALLFGAPVATLGRREMLATDGLLAFLRVWGQYRRTTALGLAEQQDLARLQVADGVMYVPIGRRLEPRAIFRVPTINLDTASAETRRGARAKWGAVLNGLPHPIQVVIRGRPATTLPVVERIKAHGSAPARAGGVAGRPPARWRPRRTRPLPGRAGSRPGDARRPLRQP